MSLEVIVQLVVAIPADRVTRIDMANNMPNKIRVDVLLFFSGIKILPRIAPELSIEVKVII